jgi:D-lactate dehydrogenase (cytochrome)
LDRLVARALALDGTATGEHGVGQGKRRFLRDEHGIGVDVMRAIKAALDPHEILNPNKMF